MPLLMRRWECFLWNKSKIHKKYVDKCFFYEPQQANFDLDLEELFRDCYEFPGFEASTGLSSNELPVLPEFISSSTAQQEDQPSQPSGGGGTKRKKQPSAEGHTEDYDSEGDGGKDLTEAQRIERRERNREHAKRSRLRKKFLLESLQEQIYGLQDEIEQLKGIIKKELPDKATTLLQELEGKTSAGNGKYTPLPTPSGFGPVKTLIEPDFRLMASLNNSQQNFAISDPSLPDNPLVYCSQGFLDLTGYTLDQVLGRNCRFLQGPLTDQSAVDIIRKGVREGVDTSVCLLNYKADGTPFWNQFFVAALRDAENNIVNYVGVQCEVSKAIVDSNKEKDIATTIA
jgi:PAS domain S-box-containing protein